MAAKASLNPDFLYTMHTDATLDVFRSSHALRSCVGIQVVIELVSETV
jgi:hypothetical protein